MSCKAARAHFLVCPCPQMQVYVSPAGERYGSQKEVALAMGLIKSPGSKDRQKGSGVSGSREKSAANETPMDLPFKLPNGVTVNR